MSLPGWEPGVQVFRNGYWSEKWACRDLGNVIEFVYILYKLEKISEVFCQELTHSPEIHRSQYVAGWGYRIAPENGSRNDP